MIQIIIEGESAFPSITLFSTQGAGETALEVGDIESATWTRKVVGTGEIVNSREDVALSISEMPFELEQLPADNTREDATRRRERHLIQVDYEYTRETEQDKVGIFTMELLVVPADRVVYKPLTEDNRYLKRVLAGFTSGDHLSLDEIYDIEEDVAELIEARLGKRFWSATQPVPRMIERIADMLGSGMVIDCFVIPSESKESEILAKRLQKQAEALLELLVKHQVGIQYADGTWDTDFPAPGVALPLAAKGYVRDLKLDPQKPFHEQHEHLPSESSPDDEALGGHDLRSARGTEYDG